MDDGLPGNRAKRVRAARIGDVARLAGVSTATVSRALASPQRVSPEARALVLAAVAQVGYVPNPAARSLRSQKTGMVLVVLPNLGNIFFSKVLRGIEETLFEAGYGMIVGDLDGEPGKEERFANFMAGGRVDGALLLNGRLFGSGSIPLAALCEAIPGAAMPQIEVDNRDGARRMTLHLAGLGHRRIAYLRGPPGNILERERSRGFRDGLAEAGLPFDPAFFLPGDYTLEAGARAGSEMLGRRDRPSAVFSSNDEMAIGLMRTLISGGVRVPDDISVAGFDDIEFAGAVEPPLTTIRQPRRELGRRGAAVLLDLMQGRTAPERVRLATELVVRASTGPAA